MLGVVTVLNEAFNTVPVKAGLPQRDLQRRFGIFSRALSIKCMHNLVNGRE